MTPEKKILRGEELIKEYGSKRVVDKVTVQVAKGEIVGLVGPNGAGKTTYFYMLVGLIKPNGGKVYLGSENISRLPMFKRANKGIGYLAQEPSIFRKMTVEENLTAILEMHFKSRKERKEKLESLLERLGIEKLRDEKAYTLSGGERRRLEIARALITDPDFLLLDEPFAGVDPIAVNDVQQIVTDLKGNDIGILITDHNVRETLSITDRTYIMFEGKLLLSGTADELVKSEKAKEIYLGKNFSL